MKTLAVLAYRLIEWLDGEKGLGLLPYRLAEKIKLALLALVK